MAAGTDLFKALVHQDLELFACIKRKNEKTETENQSVLERNHLMWNALSYTYNSAFYKCNTNIKNENVKYRTKEQVDDLLIGRIDLFEKIANAMSTRKEKRKNEDQTGKK